MVSNIRRLGPCIGCSFRHVPCGEDRFKDPEGCEEAEDDKEGAGLLHEVPEAYGQRQDSHNSQQEEEAHGSCRASWTVFRHHLEVPRLASVYNFCTCCVLKRNQGFE